MIKKLLFFLILVLSLCCSSTNALPLEQFVSLDGVHKFSLNDNPIHSSLYYDDTQWQSITIPGSWQSQGIKPINGIGWYRIHCTFPDNFRNIEPAILLGRIGDADEVFFNGIKIGGEGRINEKFIEASKIERLYLIPHELVKYSEDNVIAIRVLNTYLNGGIFDKGVTIGDYKILMLKKFERNKNILIGEYCFLTVFVLFFVSCLFFYIKGLRDKEYFYFWLFITLYGFLFFLGSVTFYETGLKNFSAQNTINAISTLFPASLLLLLLYFYKEKLTVYIKILITGFLCIALATIFFHTYTARIYIFTIWKILFLTVALYVVFLSIKAFVRKFYESGTVLLGITGLIVGFILESLGGIDLLQITGFFLWDYATAFFMICVMYALTSRYTRIMELQSASVKIFDSNEKERKRLARELHDGIGTSLLATKMKLQMLEVQVKDGMPVDRQAIPELISELTHVIKELRVVSLDLRPSFLENTKLVEAIHWHARKVRERSGIEINIFAEDIKNISPKIKENIYRIFQEAISNSVKHSKATVVDVVLKMHGKFLTLDMKDNGKGFNLAQQEIEDTGLGLYTIRERVELLGGIVRIKTSDTIGTHIFIEVPVE